MEIDNSNLSNIIASSISKLNINPAISSNNTRTPMQKKREENLVLENKKDEIKVVNEDKAVKSPINVKEVQQYAGLIGVDITADEIQYGLTYGRSVIADFSA